MGWDGQSNWLKASDVKDYILAQLRSDPKYTVLGTAGTTEFWYVVETNGKRYLFLALIQKHGESYMKKDMGEDDFPYYFNCPDKLLTLVGEPKTESAKKWREARLQFLAKKAKKWTPGDRCRIGDKTYTVVEPCKRGYIVQDENGRVWKGMPKSMEAVA